MNTPWGKSDFSEPVAPGITWYSTPSHGGYFVSNERRREMRPEFLTVGYGTASGWFEEDAAWSLVAITWPEFFTPEVVDHARWTLARTWPELVAA